MSPVAPASSPTSAPRGSARTYTRDDIVRLGQAGSPWEFLPIGCAGLRQSPGDIGLRLLVASNLARLGLRTPALDHLSMVPDQVVQAPEVTNLIRVLQSMPTDVLNPAHRIELCRANLESLGDRGPGNHEAFRSWAARAHTWLVCRASDGNIVHRDEPGDADGWIGLTDQRAAASKLVREYLSPPSPDADRPVYVEGVDPPWLLQTLSDARPRQATGHTPPITIVQADWDQFFFGLSIADLRPQLARPSIRAFAGPEASIALDQHLRARARYHLAGPAITTIMTRQRVMRPLSEVIPGALHHQEARMLSLKEQVHAVYGPRTPEFWQGRFRAALSPSAPEPLRVLIPTTRYSTFVQHASRDLVKALESLGHQTRLMIEPDDSTRFAAPAYLEEILDFQPDLVVLINYPRKMLGDAIHPNIPFVCWIQDAMPHLFDAQLGASQGRLDFVVGHLFRELFEQHGYPRSHAFPAAIVADETKFHPGKASPGYECEIAYVSHQSETPDAQHARLAAEFGSAAAPVLERLRPLLEREITKPLSELKVASTRDLVVTALRESTGRADDDRLIDIITRSYCQPVMDRIIRHQTLSWAAEVAGRRGWRFKIYGNGWDQHPALSQFAAGPLEHGDGLRSSYNSAAVHLHVMAHALVHQRLVECVLSGGFPLCRLHAPERWSITECLSRQGVLQGAQPMDVRDPEIPRLRKLVSFADAPALMQLASAMQRLGVFKDTFPPYGGAHFGPAIDEQEWRLKDRLETHEPDLWSAFGLLGSAEEFMFHSPETLERRIEAAIQRPDLRSALSSAARRRFLERFTYRGFARRMLEFTQQRLGA